MSNQVNITMKIPVIKEIVEKYSLAELRKAEDALLDEKTPEIDIKGDDEGEQLTHTLAGIWIRNKMDDEGLEFMAALRLYTQKVRVSIN